MRNNGLKWFMLVILAAGCLLAGGCEDAFKDIKLPSLADAPEKLGATKK